LANLAFGQARTAVAMAVEARNSASVAVTIGPARAPTLSGLAHWDGALALAKGALKGRRR